MNCKEKVPFPCPKSLCSCFWIVSLSWEILKNLSDLFKKAQRSLHCRVAFIQFQESVTLWVSPQEQHEMIICPSSMCSGPRTIRWHSGSLNSEPLTFITAGAMSTNLTDAKKCSFSYFQWFTRIMLMLTPSHKESYKLYDTDSYEVRFCRIPAYLVLNCQKSRILTWWFTPTRLKRCWYHNTSTEEDSNSSWLKEILRKEQFVAIHRLY